jgi:hypothetical protein
MAEVDSLEIGLQATAQKANTAIDSLIIRLGNLATSLGRVNGSELNTLSMNVTNLSTSMRAINDVGTASFTRLAKNITKIASVDSSALNTVASSLNSTASAFNQFTAVSDNAAQIGEVAKNIAKLGNKSVQTSITNMPQLATSLTNLLTTLASAPTVSNNVIQMTNALANLASQGSRVGSASRTIQRSLNGVHRSAQTATKSTWSLAKSFGKFYASYFMVVRGIKGLWKSIESTTDYIEAFNYYAVAFDKIGSEWGKDFEKYGYDNATDYANSFSDRVSALLGKLSGLQVDVEGGLLTADGAKNLGLNIQEVTEFASQLASVTNSLGQTGETTTAIAKSMTMLAGDISSLFNIDYTSVATNIQSGLIGQSRALYKYGIDITNATLQTYAYNLGIEKSVSEMTQMEKQQLRVLSILQQSKVSWGDLSNTINSPSNMIRQFNTNIKETGMVLGQIFIPVLQKVMPVVNGTTIAIKRMLVGVASLMGVKIDFDAFGQNGYQDTSDGLEDIANGYDNVAKAADKAQKGVRGFDELNVISTGTDTSKSTGVSGDTIDLTDEIVKATEEYEKVWNDAFDKMENKAEAWADRIVSALSPVKKIFKDFSIGDFFAAGQDTSALVSSMFNWFADAIDNVPWFTIGRNVGKYLAGLDWTEILKSAAKVLWEGFKGALEFYAGMFTAAPLETAVVSFMAMPGLLKAITASKFVTGVKKLWSNFKAFGTVVNNTALALSGDAAATATLATMFPNLSSKVTAVKTAFTNLATSIQNKGLWRGINDSITSLRSNLTGFQKGLIGVASTAIEFTVLKDAFNDLTVGSDNMLLSIGKIAGVSAAAAGAMYLAFGPAGIAIAGITGVVAAISGINSAMDEIKTTEIGNDIKDTLSNPGGTPISELAGQYADMVGKISDSFSAVTEGSTQLDAADTNIRSTWQEIEKIETAMENGVISVEDGTAQLTTLFGNLAQTASDKFATLEDTLLAAFGENGVLSEVFHRLGISTEDTVATVITLNDKVNQRIEELTSELATMDPSNPNYAKYKEELASLLATTDGLTESLSLFDLQLSQIDYSQIVLDDGTIDADAFNRVLEQVVSSALNAQKGIEDAVNAVQTSLQQEYNSAIALGDEQSAKEIKSKMDALPDALKLLKEDVALNAKEFTDTIQNDLVGKTSEIIDNAQDTFQAKNLKGKIALGGYVDKYVEDTVSKYNEGIGNISSSIETSMSTLGISGAGWGKDASKKIYDSLFSYGLDEGDSEGAYEYSLNSNYKSIIDNAMSDMPGYAKKASEPLGKNSVDGYVQGITAKQPLLNNAVSKSLEAGLDAGAEILGIHSPSREYAELGKFSVLGYNQGVSQNQSLTTSTMQQYASNVINAFKGALIAPIKAIGMQTMSGFLDGLTSMEQSVYSKADEIAKNVAKTIQSALDIHSPSRVMFELGAYTTEGFKEGMESLYKPTELSVKDFGFGMVEAVHPQQLYSGYADYAPSVSTSTSTTTQNYYNTSSSVDNAETNALLREQNELLQRILAKEYGISKSDIGKASREYARDFFKRTGRDAYTF